MKKVIILFVTVLFVNFSFAQAGDEPSMDTSVEAKLAKLQQQVAELKNGQKATNQKLTQLSETVNANQQTNASNHEEAIDYTDEVFAKAALKADFDSTKNKLDTTVARNNRSFKALFTWKNANNFVTSTQFMVVTGILALGFIICMLLVLFKNSGPKSLSTSNSGKKPWFKTPEWWLNFKDAWSEFWKSDVPVKK